MSDLKELPLFPLNTVLFPGMDLPLHIFEDRYKTMINYCILENKPFGVVLIHEGEEVEGGNTTVFNVGTTAQIANVEQLDGGRMNIVAFGQKRFRIHKLQHTTAPYLVGLVKDFPLRFNPSETVISETKLMIPMLKKYIAKLQTFTNINISQGALRSDPMTIAFLTAIVLQVSVLEKQKLLNIEDLATLLTKGRELLSEEVHFIDIMTSSVPQWIFDEQPFTFN